MPGSRRATASTLVCSLLEHAGVVGPPRKGEVWSQRSVAHIATAQKKREEEKEGGERKGRVRKLLLRGLGDAGGDRIEGAKLVDAVPLFLEGG